MLITKTQNGKTQITIRYDENTDTAAMIICTINALLNFADKELPELRGIYSKPSDEIQKHLLEKAVNSIRKEKDHAENNK